MAASTLTASKPWIEFAPSLRPKDANEEWLHRRQRLSNQGVVTWPPPPPVWRLQPVERQSFDCVALYCSFWINRLICFVFCDPRQEAFLGFIIGFCTSVKHATVRFLLVWGSAHLWGLIDLKWWPRAGGRRIHVWSQCQLTIKWSVEPGRGTNEMVFHVPIPEIVWNWLKLYQAHSFCESLFTVVYQVPTSRFDPAA